MTEWTPVTRYTRCKKYSGATLKCPRCGHLRTVGHLSWTKTICNNCHQQIDKFDFLVKK